VGLVFGSLLPIGIAILVYKFIEEPARRKLRPKPEASLQPGRLAQPA
jgi:peptidoglycan/LPS O-acetylase OafA/YrhL